MKIDRFLCPFVGCYFSVMPKSDSARSSDEAREAVQKHRDEKHRNHIRLTSFVDGQSWEYTRD